MGAIANRSANRTRAAMAALSTRRTQRERPRDPEYVELDRRLSILPSNVVRISEDDDLENDDVSNGVGIGNDLVLNGVSDDAWIGSTHELMGMQVVELLEWCAANSEGMVYWYYVGSLEGLRHAIEDEDAFLSPYSCIIFRIGFERDEDALRFRAGSPSGHVWEWYVNSRMARNNRDQVFVSYHEYLPRNMDSTFVRSIVEAEWGQDKRFVAHIKALYEESWKSGTEYVLAEDVAGHTVGVALLVKSLAFQELVELALIIVRADLRGRGTGRAMMMSALEAASRKGKSLLVVTREPGFFWRAGCTQAISIQDGNSVFVVPPVTGENADIKC